MAQHTSSTKRRIQASVNRQRADRKLIRARKAALVIDPKAALASARALHAKKPFRAADGVALVALFTKALERPKDAGWEKLALQVARGGGSAACAALVVLANWGNRAATKLIIERISLPSRYVKGPLFIVDDACALLTRLNDPSAVPQLERLLAGLDPKKHIYSVPALKRCIRSLTR